ncbi:unnamed protein product [Phytophthora lilii]|uniref:Unnamed protein product n=1 Tax=Phytophthora lilii TaxID=2077276 RepID=A0A9W6TB99_9STRA|nr:unnamed protein product [Phytophthora lilii]
MFLAFRISAWGTTSSRNPHAVQHGGMFAFAGCASNWPAVSLLSTIGTSGLTSSFPPTATWDSPTSDLTIGTVSVKGETSGSELSTSARI